MSWDALFDDPIQLPSGQELRTLRDAGEYISALSAAEHSQAKWQTAMSVLLACAEGGPTTIARIALMQAINPPEVKIYDPDRKDVWRKAARQ